MRNRIGLCFFLGMAGAAMAADLKTPASAPRVYQEEFHLTSPARPTLPAWVEMDPAAAQAAVEHGCGALGFSCSDEIDDPQQNTRYIKPRIESGLYRGTAEITRVRGDHYYGKFLAPAGFTACKAGIYLRGGTISRGASFSGEIQRSAPDGVLVYADLGGSSAMPSHVEYRLLVQYVPLGMTKPWRCWPDETNLFLCLGPQNCRANPAYPEIDLR